MEKVTGKLGKKPVVVVQATDCISPKKRGRESQ